MKSASFPTESQVLSDLGDPLLQRLVEALDAARHDYRVYRDTHPDWAADETKRGSANWIHDRIWSHLRNELDGVDEVAFVDKEPNRQFSVRSTYVFRVKRHSDRDCVRSYPTGSALAFWSDTTPTLDVGDVHNLALGYRWDPDTRDFGETVISYRTEMSTPHWVVELHRGDEAKAPVTWGPARGPVPPEVDLSSVLTEVAQGQETV